MKEVNMTVGRFQPFTKGHLQMLLDGQDKNGLPAVVMMIQNKRPDSRHPFSDDLVEQELEIVKKSYPGLIEDIILVSNADMVKNGNTLADKGYQAQLWLCGDDREAPYKRMAENERYRSEGGYPDAFTTFTGTGRVEGVSGTAAREAIKTGDKKAFKATMPKGTERLFDKFVEEISKVNESWYQSLSDYICEFVVSRSPKRKRKTFKPSDKYELIREIGNAISTNGYTCDLNYIDVSELTDLSDLFYNFPEWNGDISEWEPDNCENMRNMFYMSKYTGENGDISFWNVEKLRYAGRMFFASKYDGDISSWDLKSLDVRQSPQMLANCPLAKNRKHWPKKFR